MKIAMKARDQVRLDAIRMLVSAIKYAVVDNPKLNDEQMQAVLAKEAKKRRESIVAYKAGGRSELADKEQFELELIECYLPKMMGEDEVRERVRELLSNRVTANIGEAMKLVMGELKGQAEGGVVAKIVKELLAK
jgi:hypothetical protein